MSTTLWGWILAVARRLHGDDLWSLLLAYRDAGAELREQGGRLLLHRGAIPAGEWARCLTEDLRPRQEQIAAVLRTAYGTPPAALEQPALPMTGGR